jgi:phosphotransferase system HPr (HPr) family protein
MTATFSFTITDAVGLHARPAAEFVRTATGFAATVRVATAERSADAKSLLEVLQLQAGTGTTVTVTAEGPDADAAAAALEAVLRNG